jgi:hypothetical protein
LVELGEHPDEATVLEAAKGIGGQAAIGVVVVLRRECELLEVVHALRAAGGLAGGLNSREEEELLVSVLLPPGGRVFLAADFFRDRLGAAIDHGTSGYRRTGPSFTMTRHGRVASRRKEGLRCWFIP